MESLQEIIEFIASIHFQVNAAAFVAIGSWTSSTINKNRIHLKINKNWTIKRSLKHIKVISDAGESPEECTYIKNISRWEKTIGYIETSSNISTLKKLIPFNPKVLSWLSKLQILWYFYNIFIQFFSIANIGPLLYLIILRKTLWLW